MSLRGIVLLLLLAARPAQAAFTDLGAGARAPGMAGAFSAVADDAYAVHYNPAGLALLERPQAALSHSRLHLGLTDGSSLSLSDILYAHPSRRLAGTLAVSWQRFSLADLYSESAYGLSYARSAFQGPWGSLYAGANLKLLGISFSRNDDAVHATDGNLNVVGSDPVLMGDNSRHVPDVDLGLLLRTEGRLSYGVGVKHLLEPNMAFSSSDRDPLARAYRFGAAYKSLWLNIATGLKLERAADGKMYKEVSVGGERYFPSLNLGQMGLRGGLALGSHDFRQLTAGLSYRISKLQFDYAFLIPLGGLSGTSGTHRLGMMFHFGAPTPEDAYRDNIARLIREGPRVEGYAYEFEDVKRDAPIPLVTLSTVSVLIDAGQYQGAYDEVQYILRTRATKVEVLALARRLEALTSYYPSLDPSAGAAPALLARSHRNFLTGEDYAAVLEASYAVSLSSTPVMDAWLDRLSEITQIKPHRVPAASGLTLVEKKMRDSETLFLSNKPAEAELLLRDVVLLRPDHDTALARLGSTIYAQGRYPEAINVWEKALAAAPDSPENPNIRYMMQQARQRLPKPVEKPVWEPGPKRADPRLIEKLFQRGIELYMSGKKAQAAEIYRRILTLEPGNAQAARALKRLEKEMLLGPGEER